MLFIELTFLDILVLLHLGPAQFQESAKIVLGHADQLADTVTDQLAAGDHAPDGLGRDRHGGGDVIDTEEATGWRGFGAHGQGSLFR